MQVTTETAAPNAPEILSITGETIPPLRRRSRAKTIAMKRLTKEELRIGALLYPEKSYWRPATRGECANVARPCPYVSCKYHLYIDVNPRTGSIKINFPDKEVWELQHSCALDVAQQGGITLEEVGEILNLTRERIRQVEVRGLMKLKEAGGDELMSYLMKS
ncbi:MAG TPA: sigma factor-like helix-turn-helix DNA-binding protein [Enhygromyxa sp.]|nr:sigma factor-like helix-turn-helix DNA-binding protein [Enhygromyxa sp.]